MTTRNQTGSVKKQLQIDKKIKKFEKDNPQIAKSLELFDISMQEYDRVVQSLSPIKTYTSNSTVASSM